MANLNLSEFTEKLFVADADHTFIWDSAASISKRVSRNSWLNSGTLTSDAPVTISQTWGTTGTYTAFKVVATETLGANTASNLLELWSGSTPALNFRINKNGVAQFGPTSSRAVLFDANGGIGVNRADNSLTTALVFLGQNTAPRITIVRDGTIGWSQSQFDVSGGNATPDTVLLRDGAANTLALRNGAAAQAFNVYGTYSTSPSLAYARLAIACDTSGNATLTTQSTGVAGTVSINGIAASSTGTSLTFAGANGIILSQSNYINLQSNAYAAVQALGARGAGNEPSSIACIYGPNSGTIDATSAFKIYRRTGGVDSVPFMVNSAGNVGIGTTSPTSKLHVAGDVTLPNGGSIFFGGGFNIYGTTTSTTINGPTAFGILNVASNGVTKWTFNYDGLLCGGGTTAAFPALKRSSTTMQARLADDTAFAPIQGKLTTDTAFTATTVTPTGFITLYDSTGTAYKVPCVPA